MRDIEAEWESVYDYILSTVFYKPTSVSPISEKLVVDATTNIDRQVRFVKNDFPYQIEKGHHYVLWMMGQPSCSINDNLPSEEDINNHITQALQKELNSDSFNFGWYENPKMTVQSVYHVQVFWCEL